MRAISCYFLLFFTFFFHTLFAQQTTFSGHFVNREGIIEVLSIVNSQGNYLLEIIRDGERFETEAKDIGGGNLEGTYQNKNKEKITFTINYENGFYFFNAENASIALTLHSETEKKSKKTEEKKNYVDHRHATGQRVFDSEAHFAFNLPDDEWSYSTNDGVFNLSKESLSGWIRIYSHDLTSLEEATKEESIAAFIAQGKFELISNPTQYKKLSIIRQYKGIDPQGRQVRFYILTMVSPYGGGMHIISGALAGKFESAYERYMKVIADSVEFIN